MAVFAVLCGCGGGGGGSGDNGAAPVITQQPEDVLALEGEAAVLAVTAVGDEPLTYRWETSADGVVWIDAADGDEQELVVPAASPDMDGSRFRCIVANDVGSVTSLEASLSVIGGAQPPFIVRHPDDATASEGQTAVFSVEALSVSALTYGWEASADGVTWSAAAGVGADSASFTTATLSASDSGTSYRCVLTNDNGSTTSEAATLTVAALPGVPTITQHPADVSVSRAEAASFSVTATSADSLAYRWQLSTDSGATWNDIASAATNATYTISSPTAAMSGRMYRCRVTNSAGPAFSNAATLTVRYPVMSVRLDGDEIATGVEHQIPQTSAGVARTVTYTIENTGTDPLTTANFQRSASNQVFYEIVTPPAATVAVGESTEFVVSFTPYRDDADWNITWFFNSNDPVYSNFQVRQRGRSKTFDEVLDAFSPALQHPSTVVQWVDVDGDGDLDLFVSGGVDGTVLYRNDGGAFFAMTGTGLPVQAQRAAWADYDGDGCMDVAVLGSKRDTLDSIEDRAGIYRNNGDGTFSLAVDLGRIEFGALAWADFTGDGAPDLAISARVFNSPSWEALSVILPNNEGTSFGSPIALPVGTTLGGHILPADYDNDGDIDIFMTRVKPDGGSTYNKARLLRNDDGVFVEIEIDPALSSTAHAAAWGDLDGDGLLDLILTSVTAPTYNRTFAYNNIDGVLTKAASHLALVTNGEAAVCVDFNNDGRLDVMVSGLDHGSSGARSLWPLWQTESDGFIGTRSLPGGTTPQFSVGDFDGDGALDLAVAYPYDQYFSHPVRIFRNISGVTNQPPAAPTSLEATVTTDSATAVTFKWNPATDDTTPADSLTYNLHVWREGSPDITVVPPMSDSATGRRLIPQHGNAGMKTDGGGGKRTWTIIIDEPGIYGWTVQAVDACFVGGPWAEAGSFTIPE